MADVHCGQVAILYPGDHEIKQNATPENNRLAPVFQALANLRVHAAPAVYNDEFCEEVRHHLTLPKPYSHGYKQQIKGANDQVFTRFAKGKCSLVHGGEP